MDEMKRINYDIIEKQGIKEYLTGRLRASAMDDAFETGNAPVKKTAPAAKRTLPGFLGHKQRRQLLIARFSDDSQKIVDLDPIMELYDMDFLSESLKALYGRPMAHPDLRYVRMMRMGMPREAVIYMLCNAEEMTENYYIEDFAYYDKMYWRYGRAKKIRELPIIKYIVLLFTTPLRLKKMEADYIDAEVDNASRHIGEIGRFKNIEELLEAQQTQLDGLLERVGRIEAQREEIKEDDEKKENTARELHTVELQHIENIREDIATKLDVLLEMLKKQ